MLTLAFVDLEKKKAKLKCFSGNFLLSSGNIESSYRKATAAKAVAAETSNMDPMDGWIKVISNLEVPLPNVLDLDCPVLALL